MPKTETDEQAKPYYCLHCMRPIEPIMMGDDAVYIHDEVPHPPETRFDEETRPQ
jgi:hypothetical protein